MLTFNGATKGNWFDAGVWLNASGVATNWQDGAIAVITNKEITLTADAYVYGFNVYMTGRYCVYGVGKLTVGAGGITKNGASGEFNIQSSGGLVLSESQLWNAPVSGMICLDGMRSLTASNGVVVSGIGGTTSLRMNTASGGLIQVYDGAGFDSATMTLGGGTVSFLATTTMNCALPLISNSTINATAPAVGTLGGVVSGGKKLVVNGSGRLLMAGGGTSIGEIFVQSSGDFTIISNLVTVTGYAGIESGGKRFAVADGGTFNMIGNSANLHAGMGAGDCTFEVLTGGVYNVSSGVLGTGTLSLTGGGLLRFAQPSTN